MIKLIFSLIPISLLSNAQLCRQWYPRKQQSVLGAPHWCDSKLCRFTRQQCLLLTLLVEIHQPCSDSSIRQPSLRSRVPSGRAYAWTFLWPHKFYSIVKEDRKCSATDRLQIESRFRTCINSQELRLTAKVQQQGPVPSPKYLCCPGLRANRLHDMYPF